MAVYRVRVDNLTEILQAPRRTQGAPRLVAVSSNANGVTLKHVDYEDLPVEARPAGHVRRATIIVDLQQDEDDKFFRCTVRDVYLPADPKDLELGQGDWATLKQMPPDWKPGDPYGA